METGIGVPRGGPGIPPDHDDALASLTAEVARNYSVIPLLGQPTGCGFAPGLPNPVAT